MNPTGNHILIKPTTIFDRIIRNILVVASKTAAAVRMAYEIPFRVLPDSVFSWRIVQEYHLKPADLESIDVLVFIAAFRVQLFH